MGKGRQKTKYHCNLSPESIFIYMTFNLMTWLCDFQWYILKSLHTSRYLPSDFLKHSIVVRAKLHFHRWNCIWEPTVIQKKVSIVVLSTFWCAMKKMKNVINLTGNDKSHKLTNGKKEKGKRWSTNNGKIKFKLLVFG